MSSTTCGQRPPLRPREFPVSGFETIDPSIKVEEETLPFYDPKMFYPTRVGEVFRNQYQVVAKLGYGTTSTTWLCHDLINHRYVTLKIHVNTLTDIREREVYQYLQGIESEHPGRRAIRMLEDTFEIRGPNGTHETFVLPPLGMSVGTLQDLMPEHVFEQVFARSAIMQVLLALDFLHGVANVTHTDVHAGNLLVGISDDSYLAQFEEAEMARPSARKQGNETTIYVSQVLLAGPGPLYLCDFGEAHIGDQHEGLAMPIQYRAPEVLLDMSWGHAVDMWSVGLVVWNLLEPEPLFRIYDAGNKELNTANHLANMVAILGPPPLDFLKRSEKSKMYWDVHGAWKGIVPIPEERKLESLATSLQGADRVDFLDFMQSVLCWLPEERLNTAELFSHRWLTKPLNNARV